MWQADAACIPSDAGGVLSVGLTGIVNARTGSAAALDAAFERIRRITGYLVGTLDRLGDAKRAEEPDRVKHEL